MIGPFYDSLSPATCENEKTTSSDAVAAESGRKPPVRVSTRFSLLSTDNEQAGVGRETAEPVSRDQILGRER